MKRSASLLLLLGALWLLGCGGPPAPTVDPTVAASLRQGLVLRYACDGNAQDGSGNGNDGLVRGATVTADRFGRMAGAFRFDGKDYIVTRSEVPVSDEYSISLWVRPDVGSAGVILYRGNMDSCWYDPYVTVAADVLVAAVSGCEGRGRIGEAPLVAGKWHHLALVIITDTQRLYLDGQEVAVARHARAGAPVPLYIGGTGLGEGYFYGFEGAIDDVAVYDRPLSAVEIQALYSERGWTPGPDR